jgi:hypothetical protein
MRRVRPRPAFVVSSVLITAAVLAGCTTQLSPLPPGPAAPAVVPTLPPSFPPQELIGRWGYAARNQCKQPYVIGAGSSGGLIMHLADQKEPQELRLKGAPGGKNYIGPEGEPGGMQDREVVTFDGRVLITRWMDPEVAGRYGNGVYVRCPPRA